MVSVTDVGGTNSTGVPRGFLQGELGGETEAEARGARQAPHHLEQRQRKDDDYD